MHYESLEKWKSAVAGSLARRDSGLYIVAGLASHAAPVMSAAREAFAATGEPYQDIETYQDIDAIRWEEPFRESLKTRLSMWSLGMYPRQGAILDQFVPVTTAVGLSYGHTVVVHAHQTTIRDVFRRFGREHPLDLELVRGIYSVTGAMDDGSAGLVEDMRLYRDDDEVLMAAEVELKHVYRFSIRRAMEQVERGELQLADVEARFGEYSVRTWRKQPSAA